MEEGRWASGPEFLDLLWLGRVGLGSGGLAQERSLLLRGPELALAAVRTGPRASILSLALILLASAPDFSTGETRPGPGLQGSLVLFPIPALGLWDPSQVLREPQRSDLPPAWDMSLQAPSGWAG